MKSDQELRSAYQSRLTRPPHRRGCASPEAIDALAAREGAEADRLATLNHVMACADCRREFEQLRALAEAALPAAPRFRWWPAVAAAVLLLFGGLWLPRLGRGGPDPMRGGTAEIQLIGPNRVAAPGESFRWHPAGEGTRYRFELLDTDGAVRYSAEQRDTTLLLPDSVALSPGQEFRWWIRAVGSDQRERRSALLHFTVHAP